MTIYNVREGNTGILTLENISTKVSTVFVPNYNFSKAKDLYLQFSNYEQNNLKVKDSFLYKDIDFYPFVTSWLYWSFFSQYIKYQPLVDAYINKEVNFIFVNNGKLSQLINFIDNKSKNNWKHKIYNIITTIINKFVLRKKYKIGFYSYGINDFRVKDIKKILENKNINYINVFDMIPKKRLLKDILRLKINYIGIRYYSFNNYFNNYFNFKNKIIFDIAFENISNILSDLVYSYNQQIKFLKNKPFDIFYGLDDCNNNIYPILLSCKQNFIKTIAHQHGVYCNKQIGYTQPIIDTPKQYNWYDEIIVWGSYWKEKLLKISKAYDSKQLIIGCNKTKQNSFANNKLNKVIDTNKLNILIPYEFLANTKLIGDYIVQFINMGHTVYFKPREDEDINKQLQSYLLDDNYINKIQIIEQLNNDTMENIDVIAGTFTTLLYDLMVYYRPLWILDTEAKFLDELIDENLAYKITFNNIKDLTAKLEVKKYNINDFYNNKILEDVIGEYVLEENDE